MLNYMDIKFLEIIYSRPNRVIINSKYIEPSGIKDLFTRISANCKRPKHAARYLAKSLFNFESNIY